MALALSALCPLALAKASLEVKVSPANAELKANIEAFIGSLGDRDETALRRFRRAAEEQARQAAQALGYYQAEIDSQVRPGKDPVLQLDVQPGEPVRLRQVTVRVEGEAAALKAFKVPKSKALAPGEPLNHGLYEDAKKLIQSQALRYGFFDGRFRSQRLDIDPRAGVADIELIYDSGPRYALGRVAFDGDTPSIPTCWRAWCRSRPTRPMTPTRLPSSARTSRPAATSRKCGWTPSPSPVLAG